SPQDFVRMLAPTRTYGEKDLAEHIVSTYAKEGDKPEFEVPFLVEKKKPAVGQPAETKPADEEDGPDDDDIVEDWEMKFAKEVVANVTSSSRPKLVTSAAKIIARVRGEEEKKLVSALGLVGVDWSAPTGSELPNLEVTLNAPSRI